MLAWLRNLLHPAPESQRDGSELSRHPTEQEVDDAIDMTFPASDPVALSLGSGPPHDRREPARVVPERSGNHEQKH